MASNDYRQGRKPLHYSIYLVVGIIFSTVSKIVLLQNKTEHESAMTLFFYIGLGFILVGIIKLLLMKKRQGFFDKTERAFAEHLAGPEGAILGRDSRERARYEQSIQNNYLERNKAKHLGKPSIISCPVCGSKNYSTSNYCHMCGAKLK
jgi:hypothetical protein